MAGRLLLRALVVVVAAALVPVLGTDAASATTVPNFDWSMPTRFADHDGNGLIDYVDGTADIPTGVDATPSSWRVDLDACASSVVGAATYEWRVIDHPDPTQPLAVAGGPGCGDFHLTVPEEGAYRVELRVTDDNGPSAWVRREVVVQDFLIVSLGDSYGSGEGSPDIPIDTSALRQADEAWQAVEDAAAEVVRVRTSVQPLQLAILQWRAYTDELAHADCDASEDAALRCAELAFVLIPAQFAVVVAEAVKLVADAVIETIGDAIALAESLIDGAVAAYDAAKLIADSLTGALSATWQKEQCHRSGRAGSALAAKAIEDRDPRTSVTFVHLACSGATMAYGLLGWYAGTEPPSDAVTDEACNSGAPPAGCVPPQIDQAKQIVGDREVDAVYVSIGGNDAHFADIIIACILQEPCSAPNVVSDPSTVGNPFCEDMATLPFADLLRQSCLDFFADMDTVFDTAPELIEEGINGDVRAPIDPKFPGLGVGYARVKERMTSTGLLAADRGSRVFLSEYVDAVKDHAGRYCDAATMGLASIPGLSAVESEYVDTGIVPALTGAIEQATVDNGWTFVDGVHSRFTNRGYCAEPHYLVRAQETFLIEGRYQGMVHPNYTGHEMYRDAILDKLTPSLYPAGTARRPDQAVFADAGGPYTVVEGSSVPLTNVTWDSDGDPVTYAWSHDRPGLAGFSSSSAATPELLGLDDTTGTVILAASDADGSRSDTSAFSVTNAPPELGMITTTEAPVLIGTETQVSAAFTDPGPLDTHVGTIDWGDGTSSPAVITESGGVGTASGAHTYTAAGIYTLTFTLTDDDGASAAPVVYEYVVVYDPDGGFATGGGWFDSPSGAYTPDDPTDPDVTGRAHFGFVSKYQRGRTVPDGNTSFRFQAAELDFGSTDYAWMVISGSRATYRGTGTVNGVSGYTFQLFADDRGSSDDRFRIRIWDTSTGFVVYDNQAGDKLDAAPVTVIGGGAISVKGPK